MYNIIGLDIDNTLTEIDTSLSLISEKFNLPVLYPHQVTSYDLCDSFGIDKTLTDKFWIDNERSIITNSKLSVKRYQRIIEDFSKHDTRFYIITHRNEVFRPETEKWLKDNDVKYDSLIMTGGKTKLTAIKNLSIELMVDDLPKLFEEVDLIKRQLKSSKNEMNLNMMKVEYPYNKHTPAKYFMDLNGNVLTSP